MRGGWAKEPLVGENMTVYLMKWDSATQELPDVFDTTTKTPENKKDIVLQFDATIMYHDTPLTKAQYIKEYGKLPRSRDGEILRLREALVEQYCIEKEMEAKKAEALHCDDSWMDEVDGIPPTAYRTPKMAPAQRVAYITSLWPTNMPNFKDAEDSLDYYGYEVGIYIESNKDNDYNDDEKTDDNESEQEDVTEHRKGGMGLSSKEENWVQCDKCQKWRKLPDNVDVSELPATWYCRMNKWSRRFNKCSAAEETAMPVKETDIKSLKERKFIYQFAQRLKRMEKSMQELKYSDFKDDDGKRKYVQCQVCHKKRPLLAGMDLKKIQQPFVCWMNGWDELHASCSAPQGNLVERSPDDTPLYESRPKKYSREKKAEKYKTKTQPPPSAPPPLYSSSDEESKPKSSSKRRGIKDKTSSQRKKVKKDK
ncbi:hypothetical protein THRCLA_03663 [Thraustotheca clavata]|uniref:CW-type domain-containing protein n=1 Tax=Thraustotheca clavata TaxID=74557 RepID=A0A1W0A1A0_9STRA|nr:hypothetical protein THRCLA_03663 [Thraustotheca clavata]